MSRATINSSPMLVEARESSSVCENTCDLIPKAENVKGINSSVVYIYELLKKEPKFIR